MKVRLVRFTFDMPAHQVSAAWAYCVDLSKARGLDIPPTRYRIKGLSVRIHPDDVAAAKQFCENLK